MCVEHMVIQGTRVLQGWIHYWRMLILSSTKRAHEEATTVTIPIYKLFGSMTKPQKSIRKRLTNAPRQCLFTKRNTS